MKTVEVAAAVIRQDGRIFATQRGYGEYKDGWEFPGGKLEAGETPEAALIREIREELNASVRVGPLIRTVEYDYPGFHLIMHCFLCALTEGKPELLEHEACRWLTAAELDEPAWLPADRLLLPELKALSAAPGAGETAR